MLSVVIPAYNEEDAIAEVVKSIQNVLANIGLYEIIVVDDGSQDNTRNEAEKVGATVIRHPVNIGYGNALKTGILHASYAAIAITDADGTYPVDKIPELYQELQNGFDMVVGARTGAHYQESLLKSPARIAFNLLSEYVAGQKIPDVNSGLRVFHKDTVGLFLNDLCGTFSFTTSLTLIYFRQSYFIRYIPIAYYGRKGRSKVKIFRDTLRASQILIQTIITYNPLKLFLLISFFNLLFSMIALALYFSLLHTWEIFVTALFFLGMVIISLLFGFLTYASNQRIRNVWDPRNTVT
jgi:polyisoprenyl-phosphate glycosyltransferase